MPEPQIGKADDVKIKIHNCGICGSEDVYKRQALNAAEELKLLFGEVASQGEDGLLYTSRCV